MEQARVAVSAAAIIAAQAGSDNQPGTLGAAGAADTAAAALQATGTPSSLPALAAQGAPAAAQPAPAAPGPAATQIVQGISAIHVTTGSASGLTIHLQPGTMGAVQVHIARGLDGGATVTLQVEKPETLRALQQDAAHLHQALDRAGLPASGRQVTFELAQPASGGAGNGSGFGPGSGPGSGLSSGSDGQRGSNGFRQQSAAPAYAEPAGTENQDQSRPQILRATGINITA